MNGTPHDLQDREERLDQVVASYIEEVESGNVRDCREWLVRYPEFYDELTDFFADRNEMERIASPLRDVAGAAERALSLDWLDPPAHPDHLGSLAQYEVLDWLGQGGMGVVFKAFDTSLNRYVAIKVLAPPWAPDPDARRRFMREARTAAAISHPHIIAIHAIGIFKGRPYIVMEYVPGASLQQRLEPGAPLELREILCIGMQVASGLAAAHNQGLIHRDIKPANIMLENDLERVKITDFGLAKAVDDTLMTQLGTLAGTPRFMAPEQARGERLDRRADLFSLGGVLYALCTGKPAFDGDTTPAVIRQVCDDRPPPIRRLNPAIPVWLAEIVDRLLAKDPADRFQSATELAELLSQHLAVASDPSLPPVAHSWARRRSGLGRTLDLARRHNPLVRAMVMLLVTALLVTSVVLESSRRRTPVFQPLAGATVASPNWLIFERDFRGGGFDPLQFRVYTPEGRPEVIESDTTGLRLRVPEGFGKPVGVATRFGVHGNFEITASFETFPCGAPESGHGLGPELLAKPAGDWRTFASMARYRRTRDSIYAMSHFFLVGDEARHDGEFPPTNALSGRFRLVRQGSILFYLVADGDSHNFRELFRARFGSQDLELIRLAATPGESRNPVEVVWKDLTIKAQGLPGLDDQDHNSLKPDAE
jgi:serine/threonine protein kinase